MLRVYCGLPGHGKTAITTQLAIRYFKKGYEVFSSYPVRVKLKINGKFYWFTTYKLTKEMLSNYHFPQNSKLIIDECQNWFNARFWKETSKEDIKMFTGHRHQGIDMDITVQHPSKIDNTIRQIADGFVWVKNVPLLPFKKLITYFAFEDIGNKDLDKDYYKLNMIRVHKVTYVSYQHDYLNNDFSKKDEVPRVPHDMFESKYVYFWQKLFKAYKLKRSKMNELRGLVDSDTVGFMKCSKYSLFSLIRFVVRFVLGKFNSKVK